MNRFYHSHLISYTHLRTLVEVSVVLWQLIWKIHNLIQVPVMPTFHESDIMRLLYIHNYVTSLYCVQHLLYSKWRPLYINSVNFLLCQPSMLIQVIHRIASLWLWDICAKLQSMIWSSTNLTINTGRLCARDFINNYYQ